MNSKQFYEAYWRQPDAAPHDDPTTAERMARLEGALRPLLDNAGRRSLRLLDAGCGDGKFLDLLSKFEMRMAGIDLSEAAAERARRRCPGADVRAGSLEDGLPFPDESFDVIWCTEVIEHLFDVYATLAEFNRTLTAGGSLILTTPYHGLVKNLLIAALAFDRHFNPEISHIRFFTKGTLDKSLRTSGFDPVLWRGIGRFRPVWKSFFVVARKQTSPGPRPAIVG